MIYNDNGLFNGWERVPTTIYGGKIGLGENLNLALKSYELLISTDGIKDLSSRSRQKETLNRKDNSGWENSRWSGRRTSGHSGGPH